MPKTTDERAGDDYTAKYMTGPRRVLHKDTVTSRPLVLLLGVIALLSAGGGVADFLHVLPKSTTWAGVLLMCLAMLMAFLATTLTVLRTVVTEGEVYVQYGLWGPRVPIAKVRSAKVVKYDSFRFGGYGIKRASDGTWAYVLKAKDGVVELVWTDDAGKEKRAVFSASNPSAVVAAIEQARTASGGLRVGSAKSEAQSDEGDASIVDEEFEGDARLVSRRKGIGKQIDRLAWMITLQP